MKHRIAFVLGLAVVFVFSACSKRQYAHLTGINIGQKAKTPVKSGHYVNTNKVENEVNSDASITSTSGESVSKPNTNDWYIDSAELMKHIDKEALLAKAPVNVSQTKKVKAIREIAVPAPYRHNPLKIRKQAKELRQQFRPEKEKSSKDGGLLYWILVVLLILLLLTLLRTILGPQLYGLLILVVLIALIGHLLGLW
jgi:hypothetical protein